MASHRGGVSRSGSSTLGKVARNSSTRCRGRQASRSRARISLLRSGSRQARDTTGREPISVEGPRLIDLRADTAHFVGQGWKRGDHRPTVPARPLGEVLVEGRFSNSVHLKTRLLAEGLKQPRCEICGRTEWNRFAIPLELDHLNGRRNDNRLPNLRLLCPNCHAQTDTYRGKNIGAGSL